MNKKIIKLLQEWIEKIYISKDSWEANYYYLDELYIFTKSPQIKRDLWIETSFEIKELINLLDNKKKLLNFICITLEPTEIENFPHNFSINWLLKNMDSQSPPIFAFTSNEYYEEYYLKNCVPIKLIESGANINNNYKFFYKNILDEEDGIYSGSIYIF